MADTLTGTTNYAYDALNRLAAITDPAGQTVSFAYDQLSRRTLTTFLNGVVTTFDYDAASQLTDLVNKLGATTFSSFNYLYDNVGNRTTMNTVRTGVSVNSSLSYTYDNLYRLTQATNPLPALPDETFNYDSLGNRLRKQGQTTDATFNDANRLLEDEDFTYSYDDNGNMIQKVNKSSSETTDYLYDAKNQLTGIKLNTVTIAQYRYDGLGRRFEKDVSGVIMRYILDNEDNLLEFDGSNVLQARYTHGPGIDEPLIMDRGGVSHFYHADGLGSITDLTDINGAVVQSYVYDSFGNIEQQVGSVVNPYTYTGREFDSESGLYYYRARYYDPSIGRFINEDPIGFSGGDVNFYVYVKNNPVNFMDPDGLFFNFATGGIGAAIGAAVGVTNAILTNGDIVQGALTGTVVGGTAGFTFGGSLLASTVTGSAIGATTDFFAQKMANPNEEINIASVIRSGISGAVGGFVGKAMLIGKANPIDAALFSGAISGAVSIGLATESAMADEVDAIFNIYLPSGKSGGCP